MSRISTPRELPLRRQDQITAALPWATLALCGILLLVRQWYNPDIWSHLYVGERILETHLLNPPDRVVLSPSLGFVNPNWLFQGLIALLYRAGGNVLVTLGFVVLWSATLALWFKLVRPDRSLRFGWPLFAACIIICSLRFEERPEVVSYLFVLLFADRLRRDTGSFTFQDGAWLAGMEVLWACCHGYFLLGPALVGVRLIAALVDKDSAWRKWAKVLAAVFVASCLTPYGPRIWSGVVGNAQTMGASIAELRPPSDPEFLNFWTVQLFWLYAIATFFLALGLFARGRRYAALSALAGVAASVLAIRNLPLAVLMAAPLWRDALDRLPKLGEKALREDAILAGIGTVAGLLMAVAVVRDYYYRSYDSPARFGFGFSEASYAPGFAEYIRETKWRGLVFNHPSDGGYLQFHLPELKLYGDSRFTNELPIAEYFTALSDAATFNRLQEKHQFQGVLVDVEFSVGLLPALLRSPAWRLAYADLHRAFFILASRRELAAERSPNFWAGEVLVDKVHGKAAIEWVNAIARADRKDLFPKIITAFEGAPFLPAPAVAGLLAYVIERADEKLLERALPLVPKSVGRSAGELNQIKGLLGAVPPAIRQKYGLVAEKSP